MDNKNFPQRYDELIELLKEFKETYPKTKAGKEHVSFYKICRQQGQRNYEEVKAASEHGENITDLVLLRFLPYKDTSGNRERGGWIHIAPVLNKDVKSWFEAAGWVKPDDWSKISLHIFEFIRACVEHPHQYEQAIANYINSPLSRGFQTGMLTPILNALLPEDYTLINSKPCAVLHYFTGMECGTNFAQYPETNQLAKRFIIEMRQELKLPEHPDMLPGDIFDMFSHWLVGVKKYFKEINVDPDPEPVENLAYPFSEMFSDIDEARWVFDLLSITAEKLGLTSPDDPIAAVNLRKSGKKYRLHFNYGHWLVLGFVSYAGDLRRLEVALLDNLIPLAPQSKAKFTPRENEPDVYLCEYDLPANKDDINQIFNAFHETTKYIVEKFKSWKRTPYFVYRKPQVSRAVFDPSEREKLFSVGIKKVETKSEPLSADRGYWKIAPGQGAYLWDDWINQGYISIGWEEFGDLAGISREEFEERRDALLEQFPDWTSQTLEQVWAFLNIEEGDRIIANRGTSKILGIGTVVGPYYFVPDINHGHRISVSWEDTTPREIAEGGWRRTLIQLDREKFESLVLAPEFHPFVNPEYGLSEMGAETGLNEETLISWIKAIKRKGQAVFYGPPGTGKTYIAERLARHLIGNGDGFCETVQFHPAYSYEDFIQGIRPVSREDNTLSYPMVPGCFLDFCEHAEEKDGACVLIIDEINRANLSRVFGELMYLLEYRDREIPLAGGGKFRIPGNVLVLGTMNTADRSIALVDHALRRRFAFIALYPDLDALRKFHQREQTGFPVQQLIDLLEQVNRRIDDENYSIGISFFMLKDLKDHIEDIWRMEIQPYLNEYFFDHPDWAKEYDWEKVKDRLS